MHVLRFGAAGGGDGCIGGVDRVEMLPWSETSSPCVPTVDGGDPGGPTGVDETLRSSDKSEEEQARVPVGEAIFE